MQSQGDLPLEVLQTQSVQEIERRLHGIIDALPAAIYTTDAEGRLTHFNSAAVEFSGRVPELGTDQWCVTWKLYHPDGTPMPHDQCPMAVALKEGRSVRGRETIAERPDGKRVWFIPYPTPFRDQHGKILGGINMLLDITERKQHELAAAWLGEIVKSSDDAIISKDLDGVILSWNAGAERLFGYTAEEAIGQPVTMLIPPERLQEEPSILERIRRGEPVEHYETVRRCKDGKLLDISLTISPIRNTQGRVIAASKIARDITARKCAEQALRESEVRFRALANTLDAEVRARTGELEKRNVDVLEQSERLRDLSAQLMRTQDDERRRIARELHDSAGQILAALGMNLAALTRQAQETAPQLTALLEDSRQLADGLQKEIRTMSYLLHPQLLDEGGLAPALRWYVDGLRQRGSLEIHLNIHEGLGRLSPEMELTAFRIVQESLTNVHRHSEAKDAVIRIARDGEGVSLEIEDHGKGISAEKMREIQSQGSGVGIRGMRERIHQLHGKFEIVSNGSGTKIAVRLPSAAAKSSSEQPLAESLKATG